MKERVNVLFLYTKEYDEVTAVFTNKGDEKGNFDCYAHIGQHSNCSVEWTSEQKKAKPKQYKELLLELESIGYECVVF